MDNFATYSSSSEKPAKKYALNFLFFCIFPLSFFAVGRLTNGSQGVANIHNSVYDSLQSEATSQYAEQYLKSMPSNPSSEEQRHRRNAAEEPEATTEEEAHDPLNIVLFYADDWTLKVVGKLNPLVKTPNIDKMADNGMMFTQNCVTTSVCWISRATLMTGVYSARHRQTEPWKTVRPGWFLFSLLIQNISLENLTFVLCRITYLIYTLGMKQYFQCFDRVATTPELLANGTVLMSERTSEWHLITTSCTMEGIGKVGTVKRAMSRT